VLQINPALGRGFTREETSPGGERVVVLSDGLWRRRFGAEPTVVGKTILLNDEPCTVVGVMPPAFWFFVAADVFVPMRTNPASRDQGHNYRVLARLKPEVTPSQAAADMRRVFEQFKDTYPNMLWRDERGIRVEPLLAGLTAPARRLLLILLGAVCLVLLIACSNVANLQLSHAAARYREFAVRVALGAKATRIVRLVLTEGLILALLGGAFGLLLAGWGTSVLTAAIPSGWLPRADQVGFDWHVLVFTFLTATGTGLLFALMPALQATRVNVNDALKEAGGRGVLKAGLGRFRSALVATEVALSIILLVGAGLLLRTFAKLHQVELGFDPANVLTFEVAPSGTRYDSTAELTAYADRALERIKGLPGVEAAAVTSNLPLGAYLNLAVGVEGRPESRRSTEFRMVSPEYFKALRTRINHGRDFAPTDRAGNEPVAVVNEGYVRQQFPDENPLDQKLVIMGGRSYRIVGVVNDVKQFGLDSPPPPTVFVPLAQVADDVMQTARSFVTMKFAVRTTQRPTTLSAPVKKEILQVDPLLPLTGERLLSQIVSGSLATNRFNTVLLGTFAALGVVLAAVGVYAVMSNFVTHRTPEIGIRLALGAQRGDVLGLVLRQGMQLAAAGVLVGLAGAVGLTRVLRNFLYGVSPTDPVTFAAIPLILAIIALLACWIPARRAAKVDPMVALRHE